MENLNSVKQLQLIQPESLLDEQFLCRKGKGKHIRRIESTI